MVINMTKKKDKKKRKKKDETKGLFGFLYETRSYEILTLAELVLFCLGLGAFLMALSEQSGYIIMSFSLTLILYKFVKAYQKRVEK